MKRDTIITIIFIILLFSMVSFLILKDDRNCLKERAEDYCKSKDLNYKGINIWPPMFFFCNLEEDAHDQKRFVFVEEDFISCERIKCVRDRV